MENMTDKRIKKAQIKRDIERIKELIKFYRGTIHQLQAIGMGFTDQLNKLEKEIAANFSSPLEGEGQGEGEL